MKTIFGQLGAPKLKKWVWMEMQPEHSIERTAFLKKQARDQIKASIIKLKQLGDSDEAIVMILQGLHDQVKRGFK
jgi:hypothetical protein